MKLSREVRCRKDSVICVYLEQLWPSRINHFQEIAKLPWNIMVLICRIKQWQAVVSISSLSLSLVVVMKYPSPKCYITFRGHGHIHPLLIRHLIKLGLVTELDLITDFNIITKSREVSIEHLQLVWLANRTPTPPNTWTCPLRDLYLF